jgi:peroxin-16
MLGGYENWVRKHASFVSSIEESARSLTLMLPDRFGNAEVQSESIYTLINLISLYHSRVLRKPNPHSTYSYYYVKEGGNWAKRANTMLELLGNVQVLMEMAALRVGKSENLRWNVILLFEGIKSMAKGVIYLNNREPLRIASQDELNRDFLEDVLRDGSVENEVSKDYSDLIEMYRISGRGKSRHGSFSAMYNTPKEEEQKAEKIRMHISIFRFLGEMTHIFRPLIYVLSILKFGYSNWKSFFVSLALDSFSLLCKSKDLSDENNLLEMKRRFFHLLYYLLRPPFFERFTRYYFQFCMLKANFSI